MPIPHSRFFHRFVLVIGISMSTAALALPGPGEGPDENLAAIGPAAERIRIGMAGDYPADIARFLLVQGVSGAQLSPLGDYVAVSKSVTGEPQLWLVPTDGSQARQLTFGNGIDAPYIRFRDEGHGWRKLANRLFYARREAAFLEQQFGLDGAKD